MPIRLSELAAKSRTIPVDFEGEPIDVTYQPAKLTMATQTRIQEAMSLPAGEANSELVGVLVEVVTDWDVIDDGGAHLAVTDHNVRLLPLRFVTALTKALFDDIAPNVKTASS